MEIKSDIIYIREPIRQLDIVFVGGETLNDTLDATADLKITPEYITIEWYGLDQATDRIKVIERRNVLHYHLRNTFRTVRPRPLTQPSVADPGTKVADA
jgi:hypothetical protein